MIDATRRSGILLSRGYLQEWDLTSRWLGSQKASTLVHAWYEMRQDVSPYQSFAGVSWTK